MKRCTYIIFIILLPFSLLAQNDLTTLSFDELDSLFSLYEGRNPQQALLYAQANVDKAEKNLANKILFMLLS